MSGIEGSPSFRTSRAPRRAGYALGGLLLAELLSGCSSPPETETYIDCRTHPGGKLSVIMDMNEPGQKVRLGDKTSHTYRDKNAAGKPVDVPYDDTYTVGIEKTSEGNMVIAGGTGSPLGAHATLAEINASPNRTHFLFGSSSGEGRNDPPYFTLAATATTGSMIAVDFTCNLNQIPPR